MSEKTKLLIDRLIARTNANAISWEEAPLSGAFEVNLPQNSIRISRDRTNDPKIQVFNEFGTLVEEIDSLQMDDYYAKMNELHEIARRRALKSEEVIKEILEYLE